MNRISTIITLAFVMAAVLFWLDVVKNNLGLESEENKTLETKFEKEYESEIESEEDDFVFLPIETELIFEPIPVEEAESETDTQTEIEIIEIETTAAPETEAVDQGSILNRSSNSQGNDFEQSSNSQVNDDDLMLLARIVQNEAGSYYCSDEHQRAVASVVINRVNDPRFPDSIYGVISQGWNGECPVQYAVGSPERFFSLEPSERALANAAYVLEYGSTVDSAIWQAEFVQGEIVAVFQTAYSTTYICK